MKILGKLHSTRGHREVDYLVTLSSRELRYLKEATSHIISKKGDQTDTARKSVQSALTNVKIYDKLP